MNINEIWENDEEIFAKLEEGYEGVGIDFDQAEIDATKVVIDASIKKAEPLIRQDERERILDYLDYWWRGYKSNMADGDSRQTFQLPEDWKEAIRKGKPPYKPEDWQTLKATVGKEG